MRAYTIRRLLLAIPTLLIATLVVFVGMRLIPGSIIDLMLVEMEYATAMDRVAIEHALGLDVPIHVQYGHWIGDIIMHGDLGVSLWKGTSVTEEILLRLPVTIELTIFALATVLLISFPIGIYSAIRQDTAGDYIGRSFAMACIAIPSFWLGTLVMVFPSIWWGWSPAAFYIPFAEDPTENIIQFIVPGIILGMVHTGVNMRMMRTMMLEVLRQDYIRTAWAKGLAERTVVMRHALKNALIPVITLLGLNLPVLIGGTVIIENIFCLPGIGRLIVEVAFRRDYPLISGVMLFIASVVLLINIVVDLTYGFLDPRVHYK